jgi:hypothetical protein
MLCLTTQYIVLSQPTDCVSNSGETSTVIFGPNVNPTLNGTVLPTGTYVVAVFNSPTGLKCAGYSQWTNAAFGLSPFGATTGFAGFANGELYKYRLELPGGMIIPNSQITVTYKSPDGFVCLDGNTYKTNGISCIESFKAVSTSAVFDNEVNHNINFYPNPSSGIVEIDYTGKLPEIVTIIGASGKEYQLPIVDYKIDLSILNSGVYIIKGLLDNKTFIKKIVLLK